MSRVTLSATQHSKASNLFKALADPTRLRILYMIARRGEDNICACDLSEALNVSAPTITHHMKRLSAAGLSTANNTENGRTTASTRRNLNASKPSLQASTNYLCPGQE